MLEQLSALLRHTLQTANLNVDWTRVEVDPDDPNRQSLLFWFPTPTTEGNAYIRRAIKIESGAIGTQVRIASARPCCSYGL